MGIISLIYRYFVVLYNCTKLFTLLLAGYHNLIATFFVAPSYMARPNQMAWFHMFSEGDITVGIHLFTSPWLIGFFRVRIPIDSYTVAFPNAIRNTENYFGLEGVRGRIFGVPWPTYSPGH